MKTLLAVDGRPWWAALPRKKKPSVAQDVPPAPGLYDPSSGVPAAREAQRGGRPARPSRYEVAISGRRPTLANELMRHRMTAHRRKKADARTVARACLLAGVPLVAVPPAEQKQRRKLGIVGPVPGDPRPVRRRVRVVIVGRYSTFPDDDAPWKSLLDALVQAGMLVDDRREWCEYERPIYERGPKATTIYLEDLP